ncbi:class I SAM-dependent methyltransferase [Evansella sp. AB-rgal1]|uniref:class I SAM-dependent methyltransferase n=1 Tax=Evansella sp. AB-rgal1 TaxID=3242696 RepID=UPI00359E877C
MRLLGILPFARELLTRAVYHGDIVVDGTAGNGHDTLFLANLVGEHGKVYSFDIQTTAIDATRKRLSDHQVLDRVELIHDGHENIDKHFLPDHAQQVAGAIFNLGYFPGGDKEIVTTAETTISAIQQLLHSLKKEGILVLVVYHGHPEGQKERDELLPFVQSLPQEQYHVLQYGFTNQRNNPPFIIAIEKR